MLQPKYCWKTINLDWIELNGIWKNRYLNKMQSFCCVCLCRFMHSNRGIYNNNVKICFHWNGSFQPLCAFRWVHKRAIQCGNFGKEMHADKQAQIVYNPTQIIQMETNGRKSGHLKRFFGSFVAFEEPF